MAAAVPRLREFNAQDLANSNTAWWAFATASHTARALLNAICAHREAVTRTYLLVACHRRRTHDVPDPQINHNPLIFLRYDSIYIWSQTRC